jgi:anti-sigma factor RsiW
MTCQEVIGFLLAYLDGELPAEQRALFEEHLGECPDCVNYLESYTATVRLGQAAYSATEETLPPGLPEELVQAILAARSTSK